MLSLDKHVDRKQKLKILTKVLLSAFNVIQLLGQSIAIDL